MRARRLRDQAKRFASQNNGIAAVEFALTLPIMLVVFVGVTQVGEAVSISHKVTITARTVTDLVTRETVSSGSVAATTIQTDLQAAAQVMTPFSPTAVTVTVSEIQTNATTGAGTVVWSQSWPSNSNALVAGSSYVLPSSLAGKGIYIIYGRVTYAYTPVIGYQVIKPMTLSDSIYLYPRTGTNIPCCS